MYDYVCAVKWLEKLFNQPYRITHLPLLFCNCISAKLITQRNDGCFDRFGFRSRAEHFHQLLQRFVGIGLKAKRLARSAQLHQSLERFLHAIGCVSAFGVNSFS